MDTFRFLVCAFSVFMVCGTIFGVTVYSIMRWIAVKIESKNERFAAIIHTASAYVAMVAIAVGGSVSAVFFTAQ